ncbi:MAG: T9SS type A sorting domain-containing protein [Chitinophagales bacterium]|nr:T9SS type A sorting domain-containing protein [Chitinophagales bacterium]
MKKALIFLLQLYVCSAVFAQSELDKYIAGPNTLTVVGNASNNLTSPHDLDFVPGRPGEWWVLNKESGGGSVVVFFDAGKPTQVSQFRRDSHNDHFMANAVAISMGDNGNFCSAQEIKNTASPSSTFMGPALWSSDTSIFARMHQNNWDPNLPLGSHLDMLHQSPFGMGVAHDNNNVYWYFDGHNGNICRYDFQTPHAIGADDHADGIIHRFSSVAVNRKPNLPSHLALDKQNKWLYIVDGGNNRVIRLNTASGSLGQNLSVPASASEPLAEYRQVDGAATDVIATGLTAPCGIDYRSGRIIISDNASGEIIIYNVTQMPAIEVGRISTGAAGVMGVRIDDNNKIWFVNKATKQLVRIDNPGVLAVPEIAAHTAAFTMYPNPARDRVTVMVDNMNGYSAVSITDLLGKTLYRCNGFSSEFVIPVSELPNGTYIIQHANTQGTQTQKLVIAR